MSNHQFTRPEGTGGKSILGSDDKTPLNQLEKNALGSLDEDKLNDLAKCLFLSNMDFISFNTLTPSVFEKSNRKLS